MTLAISLNQPEASFNVPPVDGVQHSQAESSGKDTKMLLEIYVLQVHLTHLKVELPTSLLSFMSVSKRVFMLGSDPWGQFKKEMGFSHSSSKPIYGTF